MFTNRRHLGQMETGPDGGGVLVYARDPIVIFGGRPPARESPLYSVRLTLHIILRLNLLRSVE